MTVALAARVLVASATGAVGGSDDWQAASKAPQAGMEKTQVMGGPEKGNRRLLRETGAARPRGAEMN